MTMVTIMMMTMVMTRMLTKAVCSPNFVCILAFSVMVVSGVNPGEQWEDNLIRAEVQQSTTTQLDKR